MLFRSAPGGDASSQYNCEPFLKKNKPILEPNPSFDLCRLGCSIYDLILEESIDDADIENDLQRIIKKWCADDDQRNVLYKKNGAERYPGFQLYKMIARTVHEHIPEKQLEDPWFQEYLYDQNTVDLNIMNIDSYPCYI